MDNFKRHGGWTAILATIAALSCFKDPHFGAGDILCDQAGRCPPGLECHLSENRCYPPDAGFGNAAGRAGAGSGGRGAAGGQIAATGEGGVGSGGAANAAGGSGPGAAGAGGRGAAGVPASGGTPGSAGRSGSAGATGSGGGVIATGGMTGGAGAPGSGGIVGSGGVVVGSGGIVAATGGIVGSGGVVATGGVSGSGGTAGAAGQGACSCAPSDMPVCGSDGKTYGNACLATCAGATVMSSGACADAGTDAGPPPRGYCNGDSDCVFKRGDGCCGTCLAAADVPVPGTRCVGFCLSPPGGCSCVSHSCQVGTLKAGDACNPNQDACGAGIKCCASPPKCTSASVGDTPGMLMCPP